MTLRTGEHRLAPALLVAVGVMVSAWPLNPLFHVPAWRGPLLGTCLVVALTGAAVRTVSRALAPIAQLAALVGTLCLLFSDGTALVGIVPTPAGLAVARALVDDAVVTIATSPPPAPATPGIVFAFTAGFASVALVADVVGVTWGRPLGAAVPLLVPYLAAVANLGEPLPWYHLAALAGVVALLCLDGHRRTVRRWAGHGEGDALPDRTPASAALWAGALVLAILAASSIPHLPTRYLADGLGRAGREATGQVGYSPYPDLITDLRSDDDTPVMRYRTDDPSPPPIRISVASRFETTGWASQPTGDVAPSDAPLFDPPHGLSPETQTRLQTFEVDQTRLEAPYLASPAPVVGGSVAGARWNVDPDTQVLVTDRRPSSYSMRYVTVEDRTGGTELVPVRGLIRSGVITPDDVDTSRSTPLLRRTLEEVTREATTPAERADAIQRWLRDDPSFTYSLELPPVEGDDVVDSFLTDRTGYCVHFATIMILMAREEGIPARLATGFLPGTPDEDQRVVRANDAHAWPELYLDDLGWVRFEPTPPIRSGSAPLYAPPGEVVDGVDPENTAPAPDRTGSASTDPAADDLDRGAQDPEVDAGGTTPGSDEASLPLPLLVIGIALLLLVLLLASPGTALLRRRHRLHRARTPQERVDVHWSWLTTRLSDLGVTAPVSSTVRARAAAYRDALAGTTDEASTTAGTASALDRLVPAVENARYARPGASEEDPTDTVEADVRTVCRAAWRSADRRTRTRAVLAPSDGLFGGRGRPLH